jgi:hypothetical protein
MGRAHKYGAKRETIDGVNFDSRREAKRYQELKLMLRAGEIHDLRLQPRYPLFFGGTPIKTPTGRTAAYIADFEYITREGTLKVEDVKGYDNKLGQFKRAVFTAIYKIEVILI